MSWLNGAATQNVSGQRSRSNSLFSKENAPVCRLNPKLSMKNCVQRSPLYGLRCTRQFGPIMLALWLGLNCASAFPLLSANQLGLAHLPGLTHTGTAVAACSSRFPAVPGCSYCPLPRRFRVFLRMQASSLTPASKGASRPAPTNMLSPAAAWPSRTIARRGRWPTLAPQR